jgi:GDP-4-dehydro-6-deoxy-D-mannose reductase
MRVLVTGTSGFVGTWLMRELLSAGHEAIDTAGVDVTDSVGVREVIAATQPDAVVHLAAIAFAPDAAADPDHAYAVTIGGTINVLEAVRALRRPAAVLTSGTSEVYGVPRPEDLPLTELSPLQAATPYALSKAAQESVALAYGARYSFPVVATRSFNHTGPGQRQSFVVPAMTQRVVDVANDAAGDVAVGNLDVRRDFCDVRDVVNAYRLLIEAGFDGRLGRGGVVVNVCSGRAISIRWIVEELCRLTGIKPILRTDPGLAREVDAPEIRGDPSLIRRLVGWEATIPMSQTLADVLAATAGRAAGAPADRPIAFAKGD